MNYLTGKDYTWLCDNCQKVIDQAHMLIVDALTSAKNSADNEGPCTLAFD